MKLGEGAFGEVLKCKWRGIPVAVKKLKSQTLSSQSIQMFKKELQLMSRTRAPTLVLLLGACTTPPNLCLITEYINQGSLFDVLYKKRRVLPYPTIKQLAMDIAQGLQYMHSFQPAIVHRDLKCKQNILKLTKLF